MVWKTTLEYYKDMFESFTFRERIGELSRFFLDLKANGFTKSDFTEENLTKILDIKGDSSKTQNNYYLAFYIEHYVKIIFDTPIEIVKEPEKGCETDKGLELHIKPEDCKDKEYDDEFLNMLDVERIE